FSLLYDYTLPTSDTSVFIINAGKIYLFRMGMIDAIAYPDSNLIARMGFKLNTKNFVLDENGLIRELNDEPALNKTVQLINIDGSSFAPLDKISRIYWTNGMENPILINKNRAWLLSLSENRIIATLI